MDDSIGVIGSGTRSGQMGSGVGRNGSGNRGGIGSAGSGRWAERHITALAVVAALLITVTLPSSASSQRNAVSRATRAPAGAAGLQAFAVDTSATSVDSLRLSLGVDVYRVLTQVPAKTEFETQSAYAARVNTGSRPFYAFVLSCWLVPLTYDSERGTMGLLLAPSQGDRIYDSINVACTRQLGGTFTGTNAYGVRRNVRVVEVAEVALRHTADTFLSLRTFNASWPMRAADAQQLKSSLGLVLVMRPAVGERVPISWTSSRVRRATVTDPNEERITTFGMTADSVQLWVVNRATGAVLHKIHMVREGRVVSSGDDQGRGGGR